MSDQRPDRVPLATITGRRLAAALVATALVFGRLGAGLTLLVTGVDRETAAPRGTIVDQLPAPGKTQRRVERETVPRRTTEEGQVVGGGMRIVFRLPAGAGPGAVAQFYRRELEPDWTLAEELDGPVLNFRRGQ